MSVDVSRFSQSVESIRDDARLMRSGDIRSPAFPYCQSSTGSPRYLVRGRTLLHTAKLGREIVPWASGHIYRCRNSDSCKPHFGEAPWPNLETSSR